MNIVLFSMTARYALIVATAILALLTLIFVRARRPRIGAALGVLALGGLGALVGEALVALTVKLAAPAATDFNEYRWVFLSPWGRLGLYLGGAAVLAIVALSWRASRSAPTWRRTMM